MTAVKIMCALLLVSASAGASAIIKRHDIPDARYLAMGDRYRMTVVDIRVPGRDGAKLAHGNGVGTLVAPD